MMQCNHPFILRLYQTFRDARKLYMLLEFVQGGELFSVVHTGDDDDPMTPLSLPIYTNPGTHLHFNDTMTPLSCPCPYILTLAHTYTLMIR